MDYGRIVEYFFFSHAWDFSNVPHKLWSSLGPGLRAWSTRFCSLVGIVLMRRIVEVHCCVNYPVYVRKINLVGYQAPVLKFFSLCFSWLSWRMEKLTTVTWSAVITGWTSIWEKWSALRGYESNSCSVSCISWSSFQLVCNSCYEGLGDLVISSFALVDLPNVLGSWFKSSSWGHGLVGIHQGLDATSFS